MTRMLLSSGFTPEARLEAAAAVDVLRGAFVGLSHV